MTREEQIKQCEDIVENGGCDEIFRNMIDCSECVLCTECSFNYNEVVGAQNKLKKLKEGEV
jgi:hypothetical protein